MPKTFNELVNDATGKQDLKPPEPTVISGVKCIPNTGNYTDAAEKWPTRFYYAPQVGDFVCSKNGRRLEIWSITHHVNGMEIEIGKPKRTKVTASEGGFKSEGYA